MTTSSAKAHIPALDRRQENPLRSPFHDLVGDSAWSQLPEAIRRRFSKRLAADEVIVYRGEVVHTKMNLAGRLLAQALRIIGAPLPLDDGATGPSLVRVREDAAGRGQIWARSYTRSNGTVQVIRSMKRFRGRTGLEEHVGGGFGMALDVNVEDSALVFRSQSYFLEVLGLQVPLPAALGPGRMVITHRQEQGGHFSFELDVTHPLLGRVLHQLAFFRDP